jgi:hypothetical protein
MTVCSRVSLSGPQQTSSARKTRLEAGLKGSGRWGLDWPRCFSNPVGGQMFRRVRCATPPQCGRGRRRIFPPVWRLLLPLRARAHPRGGPYSLSLEANFRVGWTGLPSSALRRQGSLRSKPRVLCSQPRAVEHCRASSPGREGRAMVMRTPHRWVRPKCQLPPGLIVPCQPTLADRCRPATG